MLRGRKKKEPLERIGKINSLQLPVSEIANYQTVLSRNNQPESSNQDRIKNQLKTSLNTHRGEVK